MRRLAGLILLATLAACGTEPSPPPAASLKLVPVDSGYDFTVFVASPPGDTSRLMVVERGGKIWLRKHGQRMATPFIDLSALTGGGHEYGVYSIAFHPQYALNRRFFVYYVDNSGNSQLSEFTANPDFDTADPASEKSILSQVQTSTAVLYGGLVAFGRDGKLYFAFGDSDNGGEPLSFAQDSGSWIGKMLRIDVDAGSPYAVPPDNPYVNRPGWRKEIWQLGLRNPWRWSFDRANGDLYIADVGEENTEEVNYLKAPVQGGNNFGWPFMEGDGCYQPATGCPTAGLVTPVVEYSHADGCAIQGGYVYRGQTFPAMRGTYFYGDYCGGWIRSFRMSSSGPQPAYPEVPPPLVNGLTDNVDSFGEDANGEVYVIYASGRIYRVEEAR